VIQIGYMELYSRDLKEQSLISTQSSSHSNTHRDPKRNQEREL